MAKSCLDGYLTKGCKTCIYWVDRPDAVGCGCPFPIMHCEDFAEMVEQDEMGGENAE